MELEREPHRPTPNKKKISKPFVKVKIKPPREKSYSQEFAVILGTLLILMGIVGFVMDNLLGAHLSYSHNVFHVVSGALAVWFGFESLNSSKRFNYFFAVIYGALGILGFSLGSLGIPSIGSLAQDKFLWIIVPGYLELGTADHSIHLLFASLFLLGATLKIKKPRRLINN